MPYYPPDTAAYIAQPADHNLLAWTYPPSMATAGTVMPTAGATAFAKVRVPKPISVTNIVMFCSTAGSTLTAGQCFAALYTSNSLVAQTADQAASWASSGVKTMALAGGPYSLAAGLNHTVLFWFNGTTGPTWARQGAVALTLTNVGLSSPNMVAGTADTGITTTGPPTMGAQTGTSLAWWVAFS